MRWLTVIPFFLAAFALMPVSPASAQTPTPTPSGGIVIVDDPCWGPQFTPPGYMDSIGGNTITGNLCPYGKPVGMIFVLGKGTDAPDGPGKVWTIRQPIHGAGTTYVNLTGAFVGSGNYVGCLAVEGQSTSHCTNALSGQTNTALVNSYRITQSVTAGGWTGIIEFRPGNSFTGTLTMAIAWVYTATPPIPTPTPSIPALSAAIACIPNALASTAPTATPTRTPTPFGGTGTLGPTPSATATAPISGTATPTATPEAPGHDTGLITFGGGPSPWQAQFFPAQLSTPPAPAGVVISPAIWLGDVNGGAMALWPRQGDTRSTFARRTADDRERATIYYARPGERMTLPIRVTGIVQGYGPLDAGWAVGISAYTPEYGWVDYPDAFGVVNSPNRFTVAITETAVYSTLVSPAITVTAVTVVALRIIRPVSSTAPAYSYATLDDVRLVAGSRAHDPIYMQLPVCSSVTGGGSAAVPVRSCRVNIVDVDVLTCPAPDDILNVGGWIEYLWCRISRYFGFLPQNQQQMRDMSDRNATNEPLGTFIELPAASTVIQQSVDGMRAENAPDYYEVRWSDWFSADALSEPLVLREPSPSDIAEANLRQTCDLQLPGARAELARGFCYSLSMLSARTPIVAVMNWMLSLGSVVLFFAYIGRVWLVSNGGAAARPQVNVNIQQMRRGWRVRK